MLVTVLLSAGLSSAFGCSCSNSTPIQQTSERYGESAVFSAHVIQLVGRIYNFRSQPKRMSSLALAVVKDRYWGLPWYWPKIVLLDGSYPCDIAMAEGEDYLVSGTRARYGVLKVNGCSRTQPLKSAQIDLRTLDGSHCFGPGGTLIGRVFREKEPISDVRLTFLGQDGTGYTARSDSNGIYELRHLPPGPYMLESGISGHQFASTNWYPHSFSHGVPTVAENTCGEQAVYLDDYDFSGRAPVGLGRVAAVKLISTGAKQDEIASDSIQPDGRFYFGNVPDGSYLLALSSWIAGGTDNFYYPGTFDRKKAKQIRIVNHALVGGETLEFNLKSFPLVPISVTPDRALNFRKFYWDVQLINAGYVNNSHRWEAGQKVARVYGVRGAKYKVLLYGSPFQPTAYNSCISDPMELTVQPGMGTVHIKVPASCQ
jgi:hypothetical protein